MSYGSDTYGGAPEGVGGGDFGGGYAGGGGTDYGLGTGTQQGLNVGYDDSQGYGFNTGTDAGFNPGGYDIGGGLGYGQGIGQDANYGMNYADFSFGSMGELGQGLQANPNPNFGPMGFSQPLGVSATNTPFTRQEEPGFWGSKAQKALSFLAGFHPVTAGINAVAGVLNSQDPVKAGIQGLLGQISGIPGMVAQTAYGAYNSKDPAGYVGNTAAMTGAGFLGSTIGGALAGSVGAKLGSEGMRGLVGDNMSRDTGVYGDVSPMAEGQAQARAAMAREGSGPQGGMGGRNWTDTLMSLGTGLYGMYKSNQQQELARQAVGGSAPWTASGGSALAGAELQRVLKGDLANDPGFKLAQLSAARASSQQPGGFAASAAANAALKYQMERMQALGAPAGVGFSPASGYQLGLQGERDAAETARQAMGNINFGVAGGGGTREASIPPYLQKWLIEQGMGGGPNG